MNKSFIFWINNSQFKFLFFYFFFCINYKHNKVSTVSSKIIQEFIKHFSQIHCTLLLLFVHCKYIKIAIMKKQT